ncbi:hypothetical protein [Compostibacter hankyongensis]|uniref:hypothetical protein n=1 Tax=Compostibacter hankyongensis TaxID=1007089 RepID=UPI0031E4E910
MSNHDLSWLTADSTKVYRRCKRCRTGKLDERVPRGWLVKFLLGWLPIRRYRCSHCQRRSYILSSW